MKYTLSAEIDELEFSLWDDEKDEIVEQADMEKFIEENPDRAAKVIASSICGFVEDLKRCIRDDLVSCYERGHD